MFALTRYGFPHFLSTTCAVSQQNFSFLTSSSPQHHSHQLGLNFGSTVHLVRRCRARSTHSPSAQSSHAQLTLTSTEHTAPSRHAPGTQSFKPFAALQEFHNALQKHGNLSPSQADLIIAFCQPNSSEFRRRGSDSSGIDSLGWTSWDDTIDQQWLQFVSVMEKRHSVSLDQLVKPSGPPNAFLRLQWNYAPLSEELRSITWAPTNSCMDVVASKFGLDTGDTSLTRDVFMAELHFKKCDVPANRNGKGQPYDDTPAAEKLEHDKLLKKIRDASTPALEILLGKRAVLGFKHRTQSDPHYQFVSLSATKMFGQDHHLAIKYESIHHRAVESLPHLFIPS